MMETHLVLMNTSAGLTFEKSLQGDKIFQVKKAIGPGDLLKVIIFLIKNLCDSLNIKENMNALQILETANEIMEKFTHESLDDLILCFKKAKNGEYGIIYNRMDRAVLLAFWAKYLDEKSRFLEDKNLNYRGLEGQTFVGDGSNIPQKVKEGFSEVLNNIRSGYKYPKKDKNPFNSMNEFLSDLKEWLPTAKPEEIEKIKNDALTKNATAVIAEIEAFQKIKSTEEIKG